jgi:hypothetical protein
VEKSTMPDPAGDDVQALRGEVERLRALVGADEMSYTELKLELWRVRDELIGMEAELGNARGARKLLERDLLVRDSAIANLLQQHAATHLQPGLAASIRKKVGALRDLKPPT